MCENIYTEREKRKQAKRKHGRANWLSKFQAGLNQDVSPCLQSRIIWRVRFMSHAPLWASCEVSAPAWQAVPPPHPSHSVSRKEGRSLAQDHALLWLTRRAGYTPQPLCNKDRRTNQGRERGCPHLRMPGMERWCMRKSPASPTDAMCTSCSALQLIPLYWGYLWAASEIRLFHFTFSGIKPLNFWVPALLPLEQEYTKPSPKADGGTLGHSPYLSKAQTLPETWFFTP